MRLMGFNSFGVLLLIAAFLAPQAMAQTDNKEDEKPPTLLELQSVEPEIKIEKPEETALPLNIRGDALKEAAFSLGARGGLSWRTYEIRGELKKQARYLDKVYDFRQLLIAAPSGMLIEPPIISEMFDAMLIEQGGVEAAVADRVLNIGHNAKIVSTARTWRFYLERQWGEVLLPPDILRPQNAKERAAWEKNVAKGWEKGIDQANEIFQVDLNQLVADYQGMIRYRSLLAQGMVSPPYAMQIDRGVTGDGKTMRIGDRALTITDESKFQSEGYREWQPANR